MNTLSSYTPEEVLNYVDMPAAAYKAISELIEENTHQQETIESLDCSIAEFETIYNQLEDIINRPCFKGNEMLPEMIKISNQIYKAI